LGAVVVLIGVGTARATVPAISTAWAGKLEMSQEECVAKAKRTLQRLGLRRVEQIGQSTFGDTRDDRHQVVIRCVMAHEFAYFVVAGGSSSSAEEWVDKIKQAFTER
jgi:hypothetical protein